MPVVIGRPVPVQEITLRRLGVIPIPFNLTPYIDVGSFLESHALAVVVAVECYLLPPQASLALKMRGFHQIAAVVVFAKVRIYMPRATVEKMRPNSVKPIRLL